jgi:hypothetical protein
MFLLKSRSSYEKKVRAFAKREIAPHVSELGQVDSDQAALYTFLG